MALAGTRSRVSPRILGQRHELRSRCCRRESGWQSPQLAGAIIGLRQSRHNGLCPGHVAVVLLTLGVDSFCW